VIGCWVTSIYPRPGSPGKVPTTFFRPGPVRRLPRARLVTPVGLKLALMPPNPLPQGEGESSNSLFHKAPSPLVGEGWGGGYECLPSYNQSVS